LALPLITPTANCLLFPPHQRKYEHPQANIISSKDRGTYKNLVTRENDGMDKWKKIAEMGA